MRTKFFTLSLLLVVALQSCTSKKDILYFQDADRYYGDNTGSAPNFGNTKIQPNDILSIFVSAAVVEAAEPFNRQLPGQNGVLSLELLKLQGYLVSDQGTIIFPELGRMTVQNLTTEKIESLIEKELENRGLLKDPVVSVRLLNAKVTVLGEVRSPGTYSFTEANITLPQALGYAGDLTINGERNDVLLIREEDGRRRITHVDLTSTDWFNNSEFFIRPNDLIVVNPNGAKVKSAGFIGNAGTILTIASLILTSVVLITNK